MKWLIITGDDFGMSPGINLGIVEAHHCGILTSTSLLVNRPASEAAAALARECPVLSLGLHLELDAVAPERVHAELERQVARFVELVGALPTHLDSHHNVHHDPRVLPQVLAWARRSAVPVRGYSEIRHVSKFYGQWGGDTHLELIGVEGLLRLLDEEVRDGVTELACHPGYVAAGFRSSYAAEREVELRTLCDERVRQAIRQREIELIGFRDLPEPAKAGVRHAEDRAPLWREVLGR
ncbi:MAG TPA: ChbG/HpnK family deacetylase [Gemmatimonadales bacterium]|nr:ChbG/HpnK family deacetylase [Gemmatimonadales bacterium]